MQTKQMIFILKLFYAWIINEQKKYKIGEQIQLGIVSYNIQIHIKYQIGQNLYLNNKESEIKMILNRLSRINSLIQLNSMQPSYMIVNRYLFSSSDKQPDQEPQQKKTDNQQKQTKIKMRAFGYRALKQQLIAGRKHKQVGLYLKRMGNGYFSRHLQRLDWFKDKTSPISEYQSNTGKNQSNFGKFKSKADIFNNVLKSLSIAEILRLCGISLVVLAIMLGFFEDNHPEKTEGQIQKLLYSKQDQQKLLTFLVGLKKIYIIPKKSSSIQQENQAQNQGSMNKAQSQKINKKKQIARVKRSWTSYKIQMVDKSDKMHTIQSYEGDPNALLHLLQKLQTNLPKSDKAEVFFKNPQEYSLYEAFAETFRLMVPFLMIAIPLYIFKKSSPDTIIRQLGQGKKDFKIEATKNIKVKFDDVAGMEQAKKQITQFVDFLKNGQKYRKVGAKIPKGALLTGPPGTGKTMLAKACAGQANVSFFYISGSEFVQIFVGLGASKVRGLFDKARQEAPSIIFIDQIDAIGKKRENSRNQQKDSTLNQLLVQMDGFTSSQTVIILGATNRKQTLDSALTRPGRFDRLVEVTLPDIKARQQIFMVHLKPLKVSPEITLESIAKRMADLSPGFSGADIANLCNEAAIIASRKSSKYIQHLDFEQAAERITAGYVKTNLTNKKTKKRVAFHEAGHAVSSWFLKGGDPLVKLTIIPRSKGALGYAQYMPKASYIKTKSQLIDKVAIMLGGITSQEIFFGNMSSGGSDDLQKVYDLTKKMITQFGMGESTYNVTMDEETYVQKQSIYLSDLMDFEISLVLQQAKTRCKNILLEKRQIIENLSNALLQKETLNSSDILEIMGERADFQNENSSQQPPKSTNVQ